MLTVENLSKEFPTPTEPLQVLRSVNLKMNDGQNLAVVGPSGCGKSTLLHIIGTLDLPTRGKVRFGELNPFSLPPNELADFRNAHIGFVFQEHYLLPQLTALENILVPTLAKGSATPDWVDRGNHLLESVGLGSRSRHRPAELSGGERQRVAIARAMILNPSILLADEPTGNLDQDTAALIGDLLLKIQKQENAMMICVTHSPEFALLFESTRKLDHGQLVEFEPQTEESR